MRIHGIIVKGEGQATTAFQLPTANLSVDKSGLAEIKTGVYASRATVAGNTYDGITFIGEAHLLANKPWRVETHCFDQSLGELTGQTMDVELLNHMRDSIPFTSEQQALEVIMNDVKQVRAFFSK